LARLPDWWRSTLRTRVAEVPGRLGTLLATVLVVLLAAAIAGCGTGNPYPPGSFDRGFYFFEHGKDQQAAEALETFVRSNPTDSLAARAQYLKAMAYMKAKEYPLAAVELRILRQDYPSSELVEDAFFQEGVAYLRQVGRIQRDISEAYAAREHFQQFLLRFPNSSHRKQVQTYLQDISDMIVRKRLGTADVFRHLGQHEAAAIILQVTYEEETDSRLRDRVLLAWAEAAERAGDLDMARRAYGLLVEEHPDSRLVPVARAALARLPAGQES
jgi:outer membrane assembly lipoprotein YfiO